MDFNDKQTFIIAYIISNIAAVIMLWCGLKKPTAARVLYLLLFVWASWTNGTTSFYASHVYLEYANYTVIPFYKDFILGAFSLNITPIVFTIAVCQLFIGLSMILGGKFFKAGCWGGIIFLVCISPLGAAAGFPATLIMAVGLFLLSRKNINKPLFQKN